MDEKAILKKIRLLRKNRQTTLKDLAKRTGLTEGYLSKIENADNAPPITTLSRIAQGLDCDISYLFLPENKARKNNPNIEVVKKLNNKRAIREFACEFGRPGFLEELSQK